VTASEADRPTQSIAAIAAALVESRRRFNQLTETSLQAKLVHRCFKPVFANTEFLRLFGFPTLEALFELQDVRTLFDLETQADPLTAWQRAVTGGSLRTKQIMHRRDGEAFLADMFSRPVEWDNDPAVAIALLDITADDAARRSLAHAKSESESASRAKRRFLDAASHGLRTPLHAAMGRLQLLQRAMLPPTQADLADEAMRACQRLLHHVEDVLDCAALETGDLIWANETFSPVTVVENAAHIPKDSVEGVAIVVRVSGPSNVQRIGDERRVQRVALALIEEAIARGPLGAIELEVVLEAEGLTLILQSPSACGVSTEDTTSGGAVAGIAMARMLVSAMGGVIVERTPGSHAWSATAFLPLAAAAPAQPVQKKPTPKGSRILIIEDNAGNRRLLKVILSSLGQLPTAVASGPEGIAEAASNPYDLILMDLCMPGMDGFETTRRIRSLQGQAAEVPIVALTANCSLDVRERTQEAGMDGFLQKPVDIQRLAAAIALFARSDESSVEPAELNHVQSQNNEDKNKNGRERGHALIPELESETWIV
jgi:CheY-like chemotaxis protein/signal transduction histidine kinase